MKIKILLGISVLAAFTTALGQGAAFTYQGRLNDGGSPAHGNYDFRFKLFRDSDGNTQAGPTLLTNGYSLTNGLFMASLDFGAGIFNGSSYWLEVDVRTNGGGGYVNLSPLQAIRPTPYAVFANTAANLTGIPSITDSPDLISGASVNFVDAGVQGAVIAGGGTTNFSGAASSNHISADFGSIGGGSGNTIQSGADHSFIGSGWNNLITNNAYQSVIVGGWFNTILGQSSFIGGGEGNVVWYDHSVVAGGFRNTNSASWAVIGGGEFNTANVFFSTVGGGEGNIAGNGATVSGGIQNSADNAGAVGGGSLNRATNLLSTVPGGTLNTAGGQYSFAAGQRANALHTGAFVWADSQAADFASTANDQFLVRAQGGVGINMNNPGGASLYVKGTRTNGFGNSVGFFENSSTAANAAPALRVVCDGGTNLDGALSVSSNGKGLIAEFGNAVSFVVAITNDGTIYSKGLALTSDRNAKENFAPLDTKMVLAKIAAMPVTAWNYKDDSADKKHIGPVAQDFSAAFGLNGGDDTHISVVDEGGVALAAIQGLNLKMEDGSQKSEARIQKLEMENAELRQRLEKIEKLINANGPISSTR